MSFPLKLDNIIFSGPQSKSPTNRDAVFTKSGAHIIYLTLQQFSKYFLDVSVRNKASNLKITVFGFNLNKIHINIFFREEEMILILTQQNKLLNLRTEMRVEKQT